MPTTYERERQLQSEIGPRVARDLPGVDVLAVELLTPSHLCVYVDHPDGVDHALCGRVTDALDDYRREYAVDVSSPGAERPLRRREHFAAVAGRRVRVRTAGRKTKGTVAAAGPEFLTLATAVGELEIPYEEIVRANLIPTSDVKGGVT